MSVEERGTGCYGGFLCESVGKDVDLGQIECSDVGTEKRMHRYPFYLYSPAELRFSCKLRAQLIAGANSRSWETLTGQAAVRPKVWQRLSRA